MFLTLRKPSICVAPTSIPYDSARSKYTAPSMWLSLTVTYFVVDVGQPLLHSIQSLSYTPELMPRAVTEAVNDSRA